MGELFTVLDFEDQSKWFIIAKATYNNEEYRYLIKVENDDFKEEFMLVKYYIKDGEEYIAKVNDQNIISNVMALIYPEIKPLLEQKDKLLQLLQN